MDPGRAPLPVPLSSDGPFTAFAFRVHKMIVKGEFRRAIEAADHYEALIRLAGDEITLGYLQQCRMFALMWMGRDREAVTVGQELLRLRERLGNRVAEAKTRADLVEMQFRLGRLDEGLEGLARASATLAPIDSNDLRYLAAVNSLANAAHGVELYELGEQACRRVMHRVGTRMNFACPIHETYVMLLLEWGLRLEQIGRPDEARARLRRCRAIAVEIITDLELRESTPTLVMKGAYALTLAKLGEFTAALALAREIIGPLREEQQYMDARLAHLAAGLAIHAAGDVEGAHRELLAAQQLCEYGSTRMERLQVQYELARLAAAQVAPAHARDLMNAVHEQARCLWELRLERVAMLRQATERIDFEKERRRTDAELLRDELTGVGNRRLFERLMATFRESCDEPRYLLLIDVDEFKPINDTYSHAVGDQVLVEIATALRTGCRGDRDVVTRFGGDEFAVFLYADRASAADIGERIRQAVSNRDWDALAPGLKVTISMGMAAVGGGVPADGLFAAADENLYRAKRQGRDRVVS
ncbi:GGDEF domain-containing protein [Actinoplanes sp. NPDC049118]|uniref:GGDEF domain-containing protein n=1 Tax=Actinoplanes sp. NPDC049118 TaxID=3155769 RepID=UPI0033C4763E